MEDTKAVLNEKGEYVIPASRRPDGTWRKERVVKAGFLPQEEVRAFETAAVRMKSKGIPGLPPQQAVAQSKPQPVQAKKEKKEKPSAPVSIQETAQEMEKLTIGEGKVSEEKTTVDPAKKLKALKKKLRDIEEIARKSSSELSPEQLEKLGKRESIENEIRELESAITA